MASTRRSSNPLEAFGHALRGIQWLLHTQPHMRVHFIAATVVVVLAAFLEVTRAEWCALLLAIGLVWGTESLNSALEALADAVHPEHHVFIGRAKDAAAAGVLLASVTALAVGLVVFAPYLYVMLYPQP